MFTYPAMIMAATIGISIVMLVAVVPNFAKTFKDLGIQLPLTTRFIIGLGNFITKHWYIIAGLFAVLTTGFFKMLRTKTGKRAMDTAMLKLPIVSGIVRKTNLATILHTLSSLIVSGVPMARALEATSRVLGNTQYRETLEKSATELERGVKLSDALKPYHKLYPVLVTQMMKMGEETGQTAEVLAKLAEFFEDEATQLAQNLASIIELVLMLLIGTLAGFFAVSMLQPAFMEHR